jgi:tripartite-type tricarboxylate transporter receptor subunit TctC
MVLGCVTRAHNDNNREDGMGQGETLMRWTAGRLGIAVIALLAGLAGPALVAPAQAQGAGDYPNRLVKIIVPFGAGGPADVTARLIGKMLQDRLKQTFVIDNRPGAGSVIGTIEAAKAPPDGYTLLLMSNAQTANESLLPNRNYDLMRDLVPIAPLNSADLVIVVNPAVPAKSLAELIALAKQLPGKLNYASSGQGTPYHMAGELFKAMTGTDIVHVPHRGSGEARNNVIGGQVELMIDSITTMLPNITAGQVRALATTGKTRSAVLPDVPTVAEAGVPGYEATIWLGMMAPAGTPQPIRDLLNAAIREAVTQPEIRAQWAAQGAVPMTMSIAEFDRYLRDDITKWAGVARRFTEKTQ